MLILAAPEAAKDAHDDAMAAVVCREIRLGRYRRALEHLQAAQEANSEAAGVAYRLAVRLERYRFAHRDLNGTQPHRP
ncbi:MAG TPA: hypothetical protein VFH48_24290 [Chloroflexota bacterium]|nr:hypothetical protein [Chloroflexota bacterium]